MATEPLSLLPASSSGPSFGPASHQVADFIQLVNLTRLTKLLTASLGSILRAILRASLLFFVRPVARYLDLVDHQLGLNYHPHWNLLIPSQSPHTSSPSHHSNFPDHLPRQKTFLLPALSWRF
ncbi:hypothetical protein PtA15_8A123 [Puccinia triticina]|uniref:Uncharacterized protein n=1 Tax=Puccinia triticina TaxID=208348 RepID=A0ABY7CWX1_9BASI|nr:uncharacterized protein PtA15_8A123 [Puccinia triticina]WAQ87222.1 hypothetical protein PtA15_8A123 [Puccinia triticina]